MKSIVLSVLKNKKRFVALVALLHFSMSWISFMKSEMIRQELVSPVWNSLTKILAFPMLYLPMQGGSFDWFPLFMVFNSFLWGFVIVAAWLLLISRSTK
jgi:hypothetical protein